MERDACLQSLFYISFRVQAREPSLQVPFTELPKRETLHLQSHFQPYLKVPGSWANSRLPNWAPMKRDSHPQSLPYITFRASSKGAPPPGYPNSSHRERYSTASRALLQWILKVPSRQIPLPRSPSGILQRETPVSSISKSPVNEPPSRFPNVVPGERCPSPEPSAT